MSNCNQSILREIKELREQASSIRQAAHRSDDPRAYRDGLAQAAKLNMKANKLEEQQKEQP